MDTSMSKGHPRDERATRPPEGPTSRSRGREWRRWKRLLPMVPGLVFLLVFSIYPLVYALRISFYEWNLLNISERQFVGLHNFITLLGSGEFWQTVFVTLKFVAGATLLELVLGLALAMLFFHRFPADSFLRALFILPMVLAPIVVGLVWRYMLNIEYGVINYFVQLVGFSGIDFFGSPSWALPTLIALDVWQWTPFMFLIILAGLQGISHEVEEAAKIDGAGPIQFFFYCLLPLLRFPIAVALVLRVIDAFRVYDLVFMTTRGGPVDATDTMSWHIYNVGFSTFDMSYAAAYSWLMLLLVLVVTGIIIRTLFREGDLD